MRDKTEKVSKLIKKLAKKINAKCTTVTSGNQGATSFLKNNGKIFQCPAFAYKVIDKIGAGDTILAMLSLAVYKKINLKLSLFISALGAALNVQSEANSLVLNKVDITKSVQSYLK